MLPRVKGNRLENAVKKYFEAKGYEVILSRVSRSRFDLVVIPTEKKPKAWPHYVQVKANGISQAERQALEVPGIIGHREIWIYKKRKGWFRHIWTGLFWKFSQYKGNHRHVGEVVSG